jgi:hypothetical protein
MRRAQRYFALAVVALSGCGGLSYSVDRDLLRDVSVEHKLVLFDAENDVSIALDERENIRRQITELKQDIRDAESKILEADQDAERASLKSDSAAEEVARMAHEVYEYKISFLEERITFLRQRLKAQEGLIYVAWAKFELAKAKLLKKNNVRGASDIDLVDFEEQVDGYVERAKDEQVDTAEAEKSVQAAEQEWLSRREKLQSASGGGQGSPWAEDSAAWGY